MRYLIDDESIGRGWISSQIRGGNEELIVEMLPCINDDSVECQRQFLTPEDSAKEWYKNYVRAVETTENIDCPQERNAFLESFHVDDIQEFSELLASGIINGLTELESDSLITVTYEKIADNLLHSDVVNCSFIDCALVFMKTNVACMHKGVDKEGLSREIDASVQEVASESLIHVIDKLPSTKALMARISMLRALNRRARFCLPWLPLRPAQEGSAIFGGLSGFGASVERAGRTWEPKSNDMVRNHES